MTVIAAADRGCPAAGLFRSGLPSRESLPDSGLAGTNLQVTKQSTASCCALTAKQTNKVTDQAARAPAQRPLTETATPADTRIIPAHCHGPGASPSTSQPSRPIWGSIALLTTEDVPAVS
jgi:hypothetical protein